MIGREGTPGTLVTWEATLASLSTAGAAAVAREGDGVGATRVAGGLVEEVIWW